MGGQRGGRRATASRAGRGTAKPAPRALSPATIGRVVTYVLARERRRAQVQVTFLTPARMRRLNRRWKGHDVPTDVLSFSLPQPDGTLAGDVYICPSVALRQSREHGVGVREELVRLVIHGTLHVLGHDHPEGPGRTRSRMWQRQERYLGALA